MKDKITVVESVSQKDDDTGATNPMLYDPLQGVRITKTRQYIGTIIICLAAVGAGTGLAWTSPVMPKLKNDTTFMLNSTLLITESQENMISGGLAIGALIGSIPFGILADMIGRKRAGIALGVPFIISWILISTATSANVIIIGRLIMGTAVGGSCVVAPVYISEIAEISIRGLLGTCFQLLLTCGILLVYVIGPCTTWENLSWICAIIPVALMVGLLFVPESPVWLLKKGQQNDAALAIKWFWGRHCDSNAAIQAIQNDLDSAGGSGTVRDLFRVRSNRNGFIMAALLMFFQQFSGVNAVIFFCTDIFLAAGSTLPASISSIIVGVVQVLMTFVSAVLVERAGRKSLLIFSSAVMGTSCLLLGLYFMFKKNGHDVSNFGWLPLFALVSFIISFSVGYGPIPWMIMGELLAPEVKGIATSLTVIINWTMAFIITSTFGTMVIIFGRDVPFFVFAVIMAIGTVYGLKFVFETKGKSNAEIKLILAGDEK